MLDRKPGDGNARRLWRGPWCCARPWCDRWPEQKPPFSAPGATVCLDVGCIDGNLVGRTRQRRRQRGEQVLPDALLGPPVIAIVDRRVRAVFRRAVLPTATRLQYVKDPADDATVVLAPLSRRSIRKVRPDQCPLVVRQPKPITHDPKPPILSSRPLNYLKVNEF